MQSTTLEARNSFVLTVGLDLTDTESSGFAFAQAVRLASRIAQSLGAAAPQITRVAADVIVVGSHEIPHLKAIFMGSAAERLMAASRCPVVIAGPKPKWTPSHAYAIGPLCPDCVERRAATGGRAWWCARHSEHPPVLHKHIYSHQIGLLFEESDMAV